MLLQGGGLMETSGDSGMVRLKKNTQSHLKAEKASDNRRRHKKKGHRHGPRLLRENERAMLLQGGGLMETSGDSGMVRLKKNTQSHLKAEKASDKRRRHKKKGHRHGSRLLQEN